MPPEDARCCSYEPDAGFSFEFGSYDSQPRANGGSPYTRAGATLGQSLQTLGVANSANVSR